MELAALAERITSAGFELSWAERGAFNGICDSTAVTSSIIVSRFWHHEASTAERQAALTSGIRSGGGADESALGGHDCIVPDRFGQTVRKHGCQLLLGSLRKAHAVGHIDQHPRHRDV